jgi:ATP-dependent Clp protease ATP-binding subunit ClpA
VIQNELKDRIADAILFGELAKGGKVRVDLGDDELTFGYAPSGASAR